MNLHRGQASASRRRDIPRAGPRQQEATPRAGSAPGTRPPPSGGEASHGQHESWICTGDQASAIRGGEASHGQYPANRPRPGRCGAKRRPDPSIPRRGAIRGRHRVVTHPSTTAGRDDLTPLLRNIWSATIRSLPAEDASRNRPNMIRIPMSVPAERTLERIVKYIICVSFVTLSLLSQMGSITILFSSPNYRESEGGKPPLHTNMQFFHP
jgi:hypothetical protein